MQIPSGPKVLRFFRLGEELHGKSHEKPSSGVGGCEVRAIICGNRKPQPRLELHSKTQHQHQHQHQYRHQRRRKREHHSSALTRHPSTGGHDTVPLLPKTSSRARTPVWGVYGREGKGFDHDEKAKRDQVQTCAAPSRSGTIAGAGGGPVVGE